MTTERTELISKIHNGETIEGKMFIIPNGMSTIKEHMVSQHREAYAHMFDLNNCDKSGKILHVWIVLPSVDNFIDHGISMRDKEHDIMTYYTTRVYGIPADLCRGLKEGESINVAWPIIEETMMDCMKDEGEDEQKEIVLNLKLTAAQTEFRYRHFGTFEHAFKKFDR